MQRLIVTSATYRQSSKVTPELLEKDPGESAARARSALPPARRDDSRQRAGRRAACSTTRSAGPASSRTSRRGSGRSCRAARLLRAGVRRRATGADLYRRSMYTFWKRTVPPPSLTTFDAPDREKCTARRAHHQHAAAGAGAAERSDLRRSRRARWRSAPCSKAGREPAGRIALRLPRGDRAAAVAAEEIAVLAATCSTAPLASIRQDSSPRSCGVKLIGESARLRSAGNVEAVELAPGPRWRASILNLDETDHEGMIEIEIDPGSRGCYGPQTANRSPPDAASFLRAPARGSASPRSASLLGQEVLAAGSTRTRSEDRRAPRRCRTSRRRPSA